MTYYFILSFHLIAIITWITSLFLIQRLVLLQARDKDNKVLEEGFLIYKKVANPAFLATFVFGIILISLNKALLSTGFWIYAKFFFISLIALLHHMCKTDLKNLQENRFSRKDKNIIYHSISPLILVAITAILVIVKPF